MFAKLIYSFENFFCKKMTAKDGDCSVRMTCGLFLLFFLIIVELGFCIFSGTFLNLASECVGNAGILTLPTWIFVGSFIGLLMNILFLMWYCVRSIFYASNGRSTTDDLFGLFVCCVCGAPVGILIVFSMIFRFIWIVLGALIVLNVPEECKTKYPELFSVGSSFFFIMAASFFAKLVVVTKKCPCDP